MPEHPLVEKMARAIAEEGFGRGWEDFLPVNAFDTDQGDLIEYARAALKVVAEWEPSEEAIKEGCEAFWREPNDLADVAACHRAMMSALNREAGLS